MAILPDHLTKAQKIKLGVLAGAIALAVLWIGIFLARSSLFRPSAELPDSREFLQSRDLAAKFREDERFKDIDVIPAAEDKTRFEVVGSVLSSDAMNALKTRAAELFPDGNYEIKVENLGN